MTPQAASGGQLQLVIEGEAQLNRWLDRFVDEVTDLTPTWDLVAKEFYAIEEEQFNSEGQGKWPALSPGYARWKSAHYPGRPLLVREGKLKTAATGGSGAVAIKDKRELQLGFKGVPYWRYHQRGSGHLPQRKVVDLRESDKMRLMKTFHKGIIQQLGRLRK